MALSTEASGTLSLTSIGSLSASGGLGGAEISAYDATSQRLFTSSGSGLQIVDLSNPASPALVGVLDLTGAPYYAVSSDVTSVASYGGIIAVSVLAADKTVAGQIVLLDAASGAIIGRPIGVGNHPDMVTFTPDGSKLLVANEGELQNTNGDDPELGFVQDSRGSVSIIDVATGAVQTASFTSFDGTENALRAAGVRIADGVSASFDFEPEYIAVSPDGTKAMVTLQENNAVGILDIATATFTDIVALGTQDFSALLADFSDRDGAGNTQAIKLETGNPVFGLFMPDGVASYSVGGQTYYVIANEGDDRDDFLATSETARLSSQDLDNVLFPTEATLKTNAELGRLTVLVNDSDTDNDGDIDQITILGGRSFSILDSTGAKVFDSGDILERIQAITEGVGNHGGTTPTALDDTRSDNKGPEPESVIVKQIGSRMLAFIGIERGDGGVAVFDVTDPMDVEFVGYTTEAGAISPEGLTFIPAEQSPNGSNVLVVSNEGTGGPDFSIKVYELAALKVTVGDDENVGTGNDDVFLGSAGDDSIDGLGGSDTVDYSSLGGGITANLTTGIVTSNDSGFTSNANPMLNGESGFEAQALLTVGDIVSDTTGALNSTTTGDYQPVGIMDGIGAFSLDDDTIRVLVNHELGQADGSDWQTENGVSLTGARISYVDIDKTSKSIVDAGIAIGAVYDHDGQLATDNSFTFNNNVGFERFCSGQLVEAHQFGAGRGLTESIYFAGEETGGTFSAVGGNVWALDVDTGDLWALPAFGRGAWENVTEVDTGTTTHVAFILADDTDPFNANTADAAQEGSPLYLYVGEKSTATGANFLEKNGLSGGKLYVWVPGNPAHDTPATFNGNGSSQVGSWVEIDNSPNLALASEDGSTGFDEFGYPTQQALWSRAEDVGAFAFSRPEDVSTNPEDGAQFVLASTGVSTSETINGNPVDDLVGTIYTMQLDFSTITAPTGTLSVRYDGNEDPAQALRSPDNLDWADDGNIYVQEDRAVSGLFGGTAVNQNEASILRIDPVTGEITRAAEVDRSAVPAGQTDDSPADVGNWESSGILDVSALFDEAGGSLFLSTVQAHSIDDQERFTTAEPAASITDGDLKEGGQLVLLSSGVHVGTSGTDNLTSIENLIGTRDGDQLTGSSAANMLDGSAGEDMLYGLDGNDILLGGDGADLLLGGLGRDILTGGEDFDVFVFQSRAESRGAQRDYITDFETRIDDIDLSAIDANLRAGGNQRFKFIGDDAFSGRAGELRYKELADGVRVLGDVNGDGRADFAIDVAGVSSLVKGDFIL